MLLFYFFFQAEDGIRDGTVTGVQTCALPISLQRGAAAVAYEVEGATVLPITEVPLIPVKGLAAQLSDIAGRFYGEPSHHLNLVGVTGTNGKTSVTQLVAQALDLLGQHCGLVGTLGSGFYGALES